jgi:hypothetical protein
VQVSLGWSGGLCHSAAVPFEFASLAGRAINLQSSAIQTARLKMTISQQRRAAMKTAD